MPVMVQTCKQASAEHQDKDDHLSLMFKLGVWGGARGGKGRGEWGFAGFESRGRKRGVLGVEREGGVFMFWAEEVKGGGFLSRVEQGRGT